MNISKKTKPFFSFLLLSCMLLFVTPVSAFATTIDGMETIQFVGNIQYFIRSSVSNNSSETWASARISRADSVSIPAGHTGVDARLYNSSGTLVANSGYNYNSTPFTSRIVSSTHYTARGTFYAQSSFQIWNTNINNYQTYTSARTPNLQRSAIRLPEKESCQINAQGLTYGSNFYATSMDEYPDLIKVMGINGHEGYVYCNDLYANVASTLEEGIMLAQQGEQTYSIPIYESDGMTVIDTYICGTSESVED